MINIHKWKIHHFYICIISPKIVGSLTKYIWSLGHQGYHALWRSYIIGHMIVVVFDKVRRAYASETEVKAQGWPRGTFGVIIFKNPSNGKEGLCWLLGLEWLWPKKWGCGRGMAVAKDGWPWLLGSIHLDALSRGCRPCCDHIINQINWLGPANGRAMGLRHPPTPPLSPGPTAVLSWATGPQINPYW